VNTSNFPKVLNELTNTTARLWVSLELALISIRKTTVNMGLLVPIDFSYILQLLGFNIAISLNNAE
jgi:hypothetical protein